MSNQICKSNFTTICRICLTTTKNSSVDCFTDLLTKLQYSIGITLQEDMTLPNLFCDSCTENINITYNFKQLCMYSQQILSDIIKNEATKDTIDEKCAIKNDFDVPVITTPDINNDSNDAEENCNDYPLAILTDDSTECNKTEESVTAGKSKECPKCGKIFKKYCNTRRHMLSHIPKEQRLNYCTICDKSYARIETFVRHQKEHSNPTLKKPCNICGKSVRNLKTHIRVIHYDNKPFECAKCNKKFSLKSMLQNHIRHVHNREKVKSSLLCPQCGRTFSSQRDFQSHLDHHAGQKSYKCSLCTFECTWKQNLNDHIKRQHSENREKKFCCTYCDKKFGTGTILKTHIRTHTGERPFSCKICERRFTQTSSLRTHMKTHRLEQKIQI